jgi:hypothetical protein
VSEPPNPLDRPVRVVSRADLEREMEELECEILLDYGLDDRNALIGAIHTGAVPETKAITRWLSLYSALQLWTTDITDMPPRPKR